MANFSPVDRDEKNKTKMVKHKLVSFAAVIALWTLVTLQMKLIRTLLKWKYIHCKNYAILAAMIRKRSYFVKKVSSRSPGLECSYGKIFIPVTEISGPLYMSPVNRAGSVSEISPRHSFLRKNFVVFI